MSEKKQQFTIERIFRASPTILYNFLSVPSSLVQWFADYVDLNGDVYTFSWSGDEQEAEILVDVEDELIRWHWLDDEDDKAYVEFKIKKSDITEETILLVSDFAEKGDIASSIELWESQLDDMAKCMGG